MYADGIISHIEVLHTSVQPSVNCIVQSCIRPIEPEIVFSFYCAHTCLILRIKHPHSLMYVTKFYTLKNVGNIFNTFQSHVITHEYI